MRSTTIILATALFSCTLFTACDTDEEAEVVSPEVPGDNGGGGGGGGGSQNVGLIDPDSIDMTSEGIFSCDGGGTDFVVYDSTSLQQQLFSTVSSPSSTMCQFINFGDDPDMVQIQMLGMTIAGQDATQGEMDAYFAPGQRSYSMAVGNTPGVLVAIIRNSSDMSTWYQSNLSSQPGSSYFTITDAQGWMDGSVYKVKVRAVFQCQMKSVSGSNTMDCVDGIFVGDFTSDAM